MRVNCARMYVCMYVCKHVSVYVLNSMNILIEMYALYAREVRAYVCMYVCKHVSTAEYIDRDACCLHA